MSFWKLAAETIGTKGVMVVIAIAGTFYVSLTFIFPIPKFKTDVDDKFVTTDDSFDALMARFDERDELLRMMIRRMEERPLYPELWKNYDLNDTNRQ